MLRLILRSRLLYRFNQQKEVKFQMPNRNYIPLRAATNLHAFTTSAISCHQLSELLISNVQHFSDNAISQIFTHLAKYDMTLDESFDQIIVPIAIQYINCFTRDNMQALFSIAESAAILKVENQGLWDAIMSKFNDDAILRYLTLGQVVHLLEAFVNHGMFINHPIIGKLEATVHQQHLFYRNDPQLMAKIRNILKKREKTGEKPLLLAQAYELIK